MSHEEETKQTTAQEAEQAKAPEAAAQETPAPEKAAEKPEGKHMGKHHHETAALQAKLEAEEKKSAELKDQLLRTAAEYDNYRKRSQKERESLYADIKADTLLKFLPVYDNLERALAQPTADEAYRKGVEMIMTQFNETLKKLGITEIEAKGQSFDPNMHNAVMHIEDDSFGENEVVEVFQKGFRLGDKVVRFAMVKVAN